MGKGRERGTNWEHVIINLVAAPSTVARQAPLSIGILQARMLEWVAIPFSRGSSQPRDQGHISYIEGSDSLPSEPWKKHPDKNYYT